MLSALQICRFTDSQKVLLKLSFINWEGKGVSTSNALCDQNTLI